MNEDEILRTKHIIMYFLAHKDSLNQISQEEIRDLFAMITLAIHSCEEHELCGMGLKLLYESCFFADLDIKDMWQIYWIITRMKFAKYGVGMDINQRKLYRHIFLKVKTLVGEFGDMDSSGSNLIVIVTSQMLVIRHAPTRRVMDYAYAISEAMGKKVMIVNDSGTHFGWSPYFALCGFEFNYLPQNDNATVIVYKEKEFAFKQLAEEQPDINSIKETLSEIYRLRPELVYNIGGSSLLADLCGMFTKTACFPCSTDIPISMSQNLFVGKKVTKEDCKRVGELEPYQKIYETIINYQLAASPYTYTRSDFGVREDVFLIAIVGNRLYSEITDTYVEIMNQIIEKTDAHFLIMGSEQGMEQIKNAISKNENVHFTGEIPDAGQAIKLCDLYCNPLRAGGGRSGFEALAQGVPVVTFAFGDIYYACGEAFGVKDEKEYIDKVIRYTQNPDFRIEMGKKMAERTAYLSDIGKTQGELLSKILKV